MNSAGPWKKADHIHLFLSHAQEGKALATDLKAELANYGIEAFVAHEDIQPTSQWIEVIESALQTSDALPARSSFHALPASVSHSRAGHAA